MYRDHVHSSLLKKEYFTKVEALECFMDLWFHGRTLGTMPVHNSYVPVGNNIMPRPKFRDYDKEDQEGKDFTFRSREYSHITNNVRGTPSSLKPEPFSPIPIKDPTNEIYARQHYEPVPRMKFKKDRKLSYSKRNSNRSVNLPLRWRFSTMARP